MSFRQNAIVVILGGGKGSRLFPLTKDRSKPAVPIAGKYRLIDVPISNALHSDLNRIFILTQFNSASLNQHVARTYNFDSFSDGFVEVLAAEQTMHSEDWFQGTADAVRKIYPHLSFNEWDYVVILSGDHLYRMDYQSFLIHHVQRNADVSIGVLGVPSDKASEFGLMKTDSDQWIKEFQEKPKGEDLKKFYMDDFSAERPYLASMGIYIFNRQVLDDVLFQNLDLIDFGKQIIPECIHQKLKVSSYYFDDYWEDIGSIRSFFEANLNLTQSDAQFKLFHPKFPIYTRQRHLSGTSIKDSQIQNSIINDGCIIDKAKIMNSVVGLRSQIHQGAILENTLLMGADYYQRGSSHLGIGENSVIKNAIIDKNVSIGKNVKILNENNICQFDHPQGNYYIRDGIVIIPKEGIITDATLI